MGRSAPAIARALVAAVVLAASALAAGKEAPPEAADPAIEARMVRITSELRCLVCQNQTIADSNTGLAVDLRRETLHVLEWARRRIQPLELMLREVADAHVLRFEPLAT